MKQPTITGGGSAPKTATSAATEVKPAFKLTSLQSRHPWLKMMVYGQHGAGKTELAGSACDVPDMCDVFILSAEKGEMTLEETDRINNKAALFPAQVDNIQQVARVKDWLVAHCAARDADDEVRLKRLEKMIGFEQDGPARRFRTVVVDSFTEIQAFSMYNVLNMNTATSLDAAIPDQGWPEFNQILHRTQLQLRAFRDLPMHVIAIAQEQWTQDEFKKMHYTPQLIGNMRERVQGFFDIVSFLQITKITDGDKTRDVRRLWLQPVGKFAAKNRKASFKEPFLDDPTMSDIFKGIGMSLQRGQ